MGLETEDLKLWEPEAFPLCVRSTPWQYVEYFPRAHPLRPVSLTVTEGLYSKDLGLYGFRDDSLEPSDPRSSALSELEC